MKKFFSITFLCFILLNLYAQDKKTRIAIVSDLDTTLSIIFLNQLKSYSVDLNNKWLESFRDYLDSNKYQIELVKLPTELRDIKSYTNGFFKMNSKYSPWFYDLSTKEGFDIVVFLGKAKLGYSPYLKLNTYSSFGVDLAKNYVFSRNRLLLLNPIDSKIITEIKLRYDNDYIQYFENKGSNKIKDIEIIDDVTLREVEKNILILNKKVALRASEKIKNTTNTN